MIEYGFEDIIINPEDPRLEGAIGKECYLSDCPKIALDYARHNSLPDRLKSISKESAAPFVGHDDVNWVVVIIKKEEPKPKPKYIPFENITEFLDAYRRVPSSLPEEVSYLSNNGIWLKDTETDAYCMVTEMWDSGIVIGDKSVTIGETVVFHDITAWEELLKNYTFLWGTPCGKLAEENKNGNSFDR